MVPVSSPPLYMKNVGWDEHEVLGHLPSLHTMAYLGLTNSQCVVIDRISRKPISVELGSRAEHGFGIWKRWENRHFAKQAVCSPDSLWVVGRWTDLVVIPFWRRVFKAWTLGCLAKQRGQGANSFRGRGPLVRPVVARWLQVV